MSALGEPATVERRLAEMGFDIPQSSPALAAYQPAIRVGSLVTTAGQLPMRAGVLLAKGKVGQDLDIDRARECAQQATLNALSAIRSVVELADVANVVRLVGYVASGPEFEDHPKVLNAASELLVTAFGDQGRHVRSAVGVSSLPLGAPIEIELTVAT